MLQFAENDKETSVYEQAKLQLKSNIKTLKYNGLQHVNVVIGPCCMVIRCHSTGRQTQTFNIHDIQLKTLGDCCRLT